MSKLSVSEIKELQQKKYRDELGLFVIEGEKGVEEAVASGAQIEEIIVLKGQEDLVPKKAKQNIVRTISNAEAQKIKSTETFSGILAVVKKQTKKFVPNEPIICLDKVADPGNLGTIIRTAEWFGIKNILLSEGSVDPYNPKVVRSTMGSLFRSHVVKSEDLLEDLENLAQTGYSIVTLEMAGKPMKSLKKAAKTVYVFGSESHGVRPEIHALGEAYTIPGNGDAESLNVAIAAAITLFHIHSV